MPNPKDFILFLNLVAPIALDPIPASHAKTIFLTVSLLTLIVVLFFMFFILFFASSKFSAPPFLAALLTNGAATINDTAVATKTPTNIPKTPPFGAKAISANILPGDAVATNPAPNIEKVNTPDAPPKIAAIIKIGFINT